MRIVWMAIAAFAALTAPAAAQMGYGSYGDHMAIQHCEDGHRTTDYRISECLRAKETGTGDGYAADVELFELYIRARAFDTVLTNMNTGLEHGESIGLYEGRAEIYAITGKLDEALKDADRVFALGGEESNAYANRCEIRAIANRELDLALADCNKAIGMHGRAYFYSTRALVYYRMGRFKDAQDDCYAALDADARYDAARYLRGLAERRLGDSAAADADIARAEAHDLGIGEGYAAYGVTP